MPDAAFGLEGLRKYRDDIADMDKKPQDYFQSPWRGCHAIQGQRWMRHCTAAYLAKASADCPDHTRKGILADAAHLFEESCAQWDDYDTLLSREAADEGAWGNPASRREGARAVGRAIEREAAAIEKLRPLTAQVRKADAPG